MNGFQKVAFIIEAWKRLSNKGSRRLRRIGFFQCLLIPLETISLFLFASIASIALSISSNDPESWERIADRLNKLPLNLGTLGIEKQISVIFVLSLLIFFLRSFLSALLLEKSFLVLGEEHREMMDLAIPRFFQNANDNQKYSDEKISHDLIYGTQALIFGVVGNSLLLIADSLTLLLALGFLLFVSPTTGVLSLLVYGLVATITVAKLGRESRALSRKTSVSAINLQERLRELLGLRKEIVLAGDTSLPRQHIKDSIKEYTLTNSRLQRMPVKTKLIMENMLIFASALVAMVSLIVQDLESAMQSAVLFLVVSIRIVPSLIKLQNSVMGLKRSQGLSAGLIDLLDTSNNINLAPPKWKVSFEVASRTRIELNKISYSFLNAREKVIEDFNYNFEEGNIYLIRGRSGIGKSTLLDILMGFRSIDSGSITYFRRNPNASLFNYVPQFPVILTESMATNISMNHARHDEDKLGELLDQLRLSSPGKNLKNLEDSNTGLATLVTASSLSGGEKQRISIARALYGDCEILAMDEPTSALDIKDAMQVMQIVKSKKINKIIVIVSHDDLLLQFADHVIEMK